VCHPNETKDHATTNHAKTAQLLDRRFLGKNAPSVGPIPNTVFAFAAKGDQFGIVPKDNPGGEPHLLELALGSGKNGMTYVKVLGENALAELHMSYFPKLRKWYVTPGTEKLGPANMGRLRDGEVARQCVLCHAVTLPDNSLLPEQRFLGVGCESCHGPGSNHIAAVQAGKIGDLAITSLRATDGDTINQVCGTCHRLSTADVGVTEPSDTARFQPYGLSQSKCFIQSKGNLTCITCHDPHTNAETNPRYYEAICLKCHATPSAASPRRNPPSVVGKPCPVNPQTKCISCHMPRKRVFPATKVPTTMPDHFIRIFRKTGTKD
jgi:hypothetical protein